MPKTLTELAEEFTLGIRDIQEKSNIKVLKNRSRQQPQKMDITYDYSLGRIENRE